MHLSWASGGTWGARKRDDCIHPPLKFDLGQNVKLFRKELEVCLHLQ